VLYRVGFRSANLLQASLVMVAAMLAICLLALVESTTEKAEAASLPQNGKIVFDRITPSGDHSIYTVDPDGSSLSRLAKDATEPAWSPDGTKIAYNYQPEKRGAGSDDVYVMNADGSGKINLTKSPKVDEDRPSWSPDGTKITFSSDREGDHDIYSMDADGSNVTHVTTNPDAFDFNADWQPLPGTTVHQPDTGGPSLLLVASALLFSGCLIFYAEVKRRM
jgi:Tol biopolymer transport system component